jgi:ribose 1,5-bisphosphate isomerase
MTSSTVKKAYSDIRALKTQGATNIAVAALEALKSTRSRKELIDAISLLSRARPTEPLMRNGLRYVAVNVHNDVNFKKNVRLWADSYVQMCKSALYRIAEIGSKRIINNSVIMTHCHSTAVTSILKKAKDQYKEFEVYVCEARPKFQGRLTARELSNHGIKVNYIVDSAKQAFINDADLVLVGADALTAEGNVVNKIGTSELALIAREADTDLGVASELLKFDPVTVRGYLEPIEEREPSEVWDKPPRGVTVRNPAFDLTKAEFVDFVITEEGVIAPHNVLSMANEKYPWLKR